MTIMAYCTAAMRELCPAVVHVDGTARPQLVSANSNPLVHAVLTRYQILTGRPALVNTSFNIHEEPIVCTPQDALKGFFEAGLDYLFLGDNLLVSFDENKEIAIRYLQCRLSQPSRRSETLRAILRRQSIEHYNREDSQQKMIKNLHEQVTMLESHIKALESPIKAIEASRTVRILRMVNTIIQPLRTVFSRKSRAR